MRIRCALYSAALLVIGLFCVSVVRAQSSATFEPYISCHLPNGPDIVELAPLAAGVTTRTLTTRHGPYSLQMLAGLRIMFAYPGETFYANVKVEQLPSAGYDQAREALIADFDRTLASEGNSRNYAFALHPLLNGIDVRGLDRDKREGGVLGVYLLLDDVSHIVTTIYFLNQEPPKRFKTMEEYAMLRDSFLKQFTSCIHPSFVKQR